MDDMDDIDFVLSDDTLDRKGDGVCKASVPRSDSEAVNR